MTKSKPRLGVDVDDVVIEYVRGLLEFYNHVHFDRVQYHNIRDFDLAKSFTKASKEEQLTAMMEHFSHHDYFTKLPSVPTAIPALRALEQKYDIHYITARHENHQDRTYEWFHKHGLFPANVHFAKQKGLVALTLGLETHIDDAVHNLDAIAKHSPNTNTILFNRPWNALDKKYEKATNWNQLYHRLK